jgi:hypothetical protein
MANRNEEAIMKRMLLAAAMAIAFTGVAEAKTTELQIFKEPRFHGQSDTIKGEVAQLENGMGREVSSVIALGGAWEVCTGDHFTGRCRVLPEGRYPTLGKLNDRIVSVRFLGDDPRFARENTSDLTSDPNRAQRRERGTRRDWEEWREYSDSRRDWDTSPAPPVYSERSRTYR